MRTNNGLTERMFSHEGNDDDYNFLEDLKWLSHSTTVGLDQYNDRYFTCWPKTSSGANNNNSTENKESQEKFPENM